jgi:hypothetical protein
MKVSRYLIPCILSLSLGLFSNLPFFTSSFLHASQVINGVTIINYRDIEADDRTDSSTAAEDYGAMSPVATLGEIEGFRAIIWDTGTITSSTAIYNRFGSTTAPAGLVNVRGYSNKLLTIQTGNLSGSTTVEFISQLGSSTVYSDPYFSPAIGSNTTVLIPIHEPLSAIAFGLKLPATGTGTIKYVGLEVWRDNIVGNSR